LPAGCRYLRMPKPPELPAAMPLVAPERVPIRLVGGKSRPAPVKTLDELLDEALADSFPASDPVSTLGSADAPRD
jgi:hypothetical protein